MNTKKIVLTSEERKELEKITKKGMHNVRLINRAKIILLLDTSDDRIPKSKVQIQDILNISRRTVYNVIETFLKTENISEFLSRKKRITPPTPPKITGDVEARIITLACGEAPEGRSRWTLRLLAEKTVELGIIDEISYETVRSLLKKRNLSLI